MNQETRNAGRLTMEELALCGPEFRYKTKYPRGVLVDDDEQAEAPPTRGTPGGYSERLERDRMSIDERRDRGRRSRGEGENRRTPGTHSNFGKRGLLP
jgi:hypothetical protein